MAAKAGFFCLRIQDDDDENAGHRDVIWGQPRVTLGRLSNKHKKDSPEDFFGIGDHKNISRKHGSIYWNGETGFFELKALGKNGITVNGQNLAKDQIYQFSPASATAVRMGAVKFYFLPPKQ